MYTISTHLGHTVARQHNLRNPKVTDKEEHIDKNGIHETWMDVAPKDAYKMIFEDARLEYNAEQVEKGHPERQIDDYYQHVCDDKKKHPMYEMVVQVGSYQNHPEIEVCKMILYAFYKAWKTMNKNMLLCGAYFHADEVGAPHLHLSFFPCARGLTRGMRTQNALVKALNQMGYETNGIHDTAQIQWEKAQNKFLENLCREHGLEIMHPEREKQKHMAITEYRHKKQIEELERRNEELLREKKMLLDKVNGLIDYHNELNDVIDELEAGSVKLARGIIAKEQKREHVLTR